MGSKNTVAPPPNYGPIVAAQTMAAQQSAQIARDQLAWAREAYERDAARLEALQPKLNEFMERATAREEEAMGWARADRARYEAVFQPLEDSLVRQTEQYTPEAIQARSEAAAGRASQDAAAQYAVARSAAQDRLESYGIDPGQVRFAALDLAGRTQEAGARAGAANMARDATTARETALGQQLLGTGIQLGQNYLNSAARSSQLASATGQVGANFGLEGVNAGLRTTTTGAQTMGTSPQWQALGNQSYASAADTMNTGYKNYLDYNKAKESQSSGWGTALGLIGGIGMSALMPGSGIPGAISKLGSLFEEGGSAEPPDDAPHSGVPITQDMSPSGGRAIDDIPARLNAGEFVVPADVVKWKGLEFFQRTIEGSRKKEAEAPAKPKTQAIPLEAPVVSTVPPPPAPPLRSPTALPI